MSVRVWKDSRDNRTPWRVTVRHGATDLLVSVFKYRDESEARDHAARVTEHENTEGVASTAGVRFDPEAITACPECGSDDLGHFDANDIGDDSVSGVMCEACKWERIACADCGRETYYDDDTEDYRHVDPEASCFLIRAQTDA